MADRRIRQAITMLIVLTCCFAAGCGGTTGPEVSSMPSGDGYKIMLSANPGVITSEGHAAVIAVIIDPQGNPVADEDGGVMFSASAPNTEFVDPETGNVGDIRGGASQVTLTWEDKSEDETPAASQLCTITAAYRGAYATVQIILISKSY